MFWKKKNKISTEGGFFHSPTDNRNSFRIPPSKTAPVFLEFQDEEFTLLDVSSGGASFKSSRSSVLNKAFQAQLKLPYLNVDLLISIEILRVEKNGIHHVRFLNLSDISKDKIHKYILLRQKKELQQKSHNSGL